ncbi:flavin reductase family protein [Ferdinandcohnia quinoae]|uniref:Flavin reductase family protein n=1 Tax=Fredinandcohnia quinoae TaxID=2918902 RepID=A0AAW5EFG4_9BACI|nr:flavin reductase family protein [Fredinandcohnia sp. SECRCQ15]MCH1627948.1 flavin reductase family protein [Fredinandcohnia sp. SECRCQ15]
MDARTLRNCFGKFATGVTVVTWFEGEEKRGITVNSFTSVSLDPALALISIDKNASAYKGLQGKSFTINVLSADQEAIAWQFAGKQQEGLQIDWDSTGIAPKIKGSIAWMECKPWKVYDGGDHDLFIGEIQQIHQQDGDGLTFFQGKMGTTRGL